MLPRSRTSSNPVRLGSFCALALAVIALAGCSSAEGPALGEPIIPNPTPTATPVPTPTSTPTPVPTPTPEPITVSGVVRSARDLAPLAGATVTSGDRSTTTAEDGTFSISRLPGDPELVVSRPVWKSVSVDPGDDPVASIEVEMEPVVVRALRVSREVAADEARFAELLDMAAGSVVNALVFDTKDEYATVLYETGVELANEMGAVTPVYDPAELIARAHELGLYTVTRIVTFEDSNWARHVPEAKLIGRWVDATNPANWEYPLQLAVEACELGFDEIQFDYVRFPAGELNGMAGSTIPATVEERAGTIAGFLGEARSRLHPLGCGLSAAIFGIVMSTSDDQRIGQTPETVSAVVDAVSPMLYPSHYSPGWLGFNDPNDHPGPVVAHSLDKGIPRTGTPTLMRPWIQGFYYRSAQVLAQIEEAESRGAGWIIWNFPGNYSRSWLPTE